MQSSRKSRAPKSPKSSKRSRYQEKHDNSLPDITFRTDKQRQLAAAIRANTLTFAVGSAGTGKTYISCNVAARLFLEALEREGVQSDVKIVCARPAVEACGERLGFLPGEDKDKVAPWAKIFYDEFEDCLGKGRTAELIKSERIMFVPLAHMRGRSFKNAIVILDEAQNTTPDQIKLLLTRIGERSKVIVDGDPEQKGDIPGPQGIVDAMNRLADKRDVGVVRFTDEDVVRSPFVKMVLKAYKE